MKVRDVMVKDVVAVESETTYEEAATLMHRMQVSGLPVIDKAGKLVGVISEKDLFAAIFPSYREYVENPEIYNDPEKEGDRIEDIRKSPIAGLAKKVVYTVAPDAPILRAGSIMLLHHVHRLPVVEKGKLVGIVSREEIYGAILKKHLKF